MEQRRPLRAYATASVLSATLTTHQSEQINKVLTISTSLRSLTMKTPQQQQEWFLFWQKLVWTVSFLGGPHGWTVNNQRKCSVTQPEYDVNFSIFLSSYSLAWLQLCQHPSCRMDSWACTGLSSDLWVKSCHSVPLAAGCEDVFLWLINIFWYFLIFGLVFSFCVERNRREISPSIDSMSTCDLWAPSLHVTLSWAVI